MSRRFRECEAHHQEHESSLGREIAVIDPGLRDNNDLSRRG
jgi:hypothetical protein